MVRFKVQRQSLIAEPICIGIPVAESVINDVEQLLLNHADGSPVAADIETLSVWPDHSVRWVLATFIASGTSTCSDYILSTKGQPATDWPALQLQDQADALVISDKHRTLRIDKNSNALFPSIQCDGKEIISQTSNIEWLDHEDSNIELVSRKITRVKQKRLYCEFFIETGYINATGQTANLQLHYKYFHNGIVDLKIEIHNPGRAQHSEGIWDLGDPGSLIFNHLALNLVSIQNTSCSLQCENNESWTSNPDNSQLQLFQASSGGQQWDCMNHCDSTGQVRNLFKGYKLSIGKRTITTGLRAEPIICVSDAASADSSASESVSSYRVSVPEFWQNFPATIEFTDKRLSLGLFPGAHGSAYELQGGEKKTKSILLCFNADNPDWSHQPATVQLDCADVVATGVIRYAANHSNITAYDKLLEISVSETTGIKANRELIDEYGWRNFGEIYANHEALYHQDNEPYISHYNNQYDPIYGFARQYLLTGDTRWYTLMHDLARHFIDIDIYNTDEDRAEYNHGMFWHTDHYLQAYTSSHRTYSKHHYAEDTDQPKGGGPGPEHCYTSGLVLYYCLTGDQRAKSTLLNLSRWITNYYEGNGSIVNFIYLLLKKDSKLLLNLLRGKKTLRYLYPLDRGVGNYIRSLMDCYELTCDKTYISRAEQIIRNTIGPNDDISERNLDDLEYTWYYTVFLQEVIRYLDVKRQLGEFDSEFIYARQSMLHYAKWMVTGEAPVPV